MLPKTYGGEAMKKSSVFEWHKRFKEYHEDMENNERCGPSSSHRIDENVKKVQSGAFRKPTKLILWKY
jgi:hypothetical protein